MTALAVAKNSAFELIDIVNSEQPEKATQTHDRKMDWSVCPQLASVSSRQH